MKRGLFDKGETMGEIVKQEEIEVSRLIPYVNNAKKHDEAQVTKIAASIREFGFLSPCLIDKEYNIIAGHGRVLAAKKIGMDKVPCVFIEGLTEAQRKAYIIADNRLSELSDWDMEMVNMELESLVDMDFDISLTGFELMETKPEEEEIIEDEIPDEVEERVKPGDIWELGEHRLVCGDSTDVLVLDKLMDGETADMVFTDPPYGMKKECDGVLNDNLNFDDLLEFNRQWIPLVFGALKDTGCVYIWGIDEPLMDIYSSILKPMKKANQIVIRNYITWAKHSAFGINSNLQLSYPKETEKCWFVMKGQDWNNNNSEFFNTKFERILEYMQSQAQKAGIKPKDIYKVCGVHMYSHWFTKSQFSILSEKHYKTLANAYPGCFEMPYAELRSLLGDSNDPTAALKPYFDNLTNDTVGDIGLTDVWRFPITSNREREGLGHATPKPIALCARGVHASSREGEIVLDVFGGSGSTMIACEQLNRRCFMIELDPHYCDVIIERWEKFTGEKAVLLNGEEEQDA